MLLLPMIIATLALSASDCGVPQARHILDFDVTKMTPPFVQLSLGVEVGVVPESGYGFDVVARTPGSSTNLLEWASHGPDPSDVLAWNHNAGHFSDMRRIFVRGYPGEVIVDLRNLKSSSSTGKSSDAKFV